MNLPDFNKFALEVPLYEEFSLKELYESENINALYYYLKEIKEYDKTIDIYCVDCKKESTFRRSNKFSVHKSTTAHEVKGSDEVFMVELTCSRDLKHKLYFIFRILNLNIYKIGQHYSLADINIDSIKKYRKILGEEKYKELSRAIGLITYGVGIGSFVYLRRIFESLIIEAYENIKTSISETDFKAKRMEEKIVLLKPFLPEFLVENKSLHSILSVGIHSLSEKECLEHFNAVKIGIELILDEKIEIVAKKEKAAAAKKSLSNIKGQINK